VRPVWTLALQNQLTVAPAYADSHAYFAIEAGRIVAYDLENGRREWIASAAPEHDLAAGDGLLFIVEAGTVRAVRAADGTTVWQLPSIGMLTVAPVWDNGWLVLATITGDVVAVRGVDGELMWRRAVGSPAHAQPSLAADRLYVPAADGRIVAMRVETGDTIWERRLPQPATALLALDDRIYAGSTDNYFYAIDTDQGDIQWRWRTGADVVGVPVVDERNVYFVSFDNVLRALSRKTGAQQWVRLLPLRPTRGPLQVDDLLIVSGIAPGVHAYNMSNGSPAGDFPAEGEIAAAPYTIPYPSSGLPQVLLVRRDIAKGATATLFTRRLEMALSRFQPPTDAVWVIPMPGAGEEK
jgi:outer membrane protein assembly factor BamB